MKTGKGILFAFAGAALLVPLLVSKQGDSPTTIKLADGRTEFWYDDGRLTVVDPDGVVISQDRWK